MSHSEYPDLGHLAWDGDMEDLEYLPRHAGRHATRRWASAIFRKYATHVRRHYDQMLNAAEDRDDHRSPYETPSGYLKRAVYVLTRHYKERNQLEAIADVAYGQENPRGPKVRENPFHWALIAVFPNEDLKTPSAERGLMFPQARNRIGRQLLYADRHDVPPEYLVGFLYQSGNPDAIAEKLKNREFEPWFRSSNQAE